VHDDLVTSCASLTRDNGRVSKEVFPDSKPPAVSITSLTNTPLAIFSDDLRPIRHPVSVPTPESSRIVHPNSVNTFNFKPGCFKRIDKPSQRRRRICARENILIHEQSLLSDRSRQVVPKSNPRIANFSGDRRFEERIIRHRPTYRILVARRCQSVERRHVPPFPDT
jgi:hypothetical protein